MNDSTHVVWLADLTHTGQSIASDAVPAAVGMIGEVLSKHCPEVTQIELFKFPNDLSAAFQVDQPNILGLSNYIWNYRISSRVASIVKNIYPNIVIVMGGPNFPTDTGEQEDFLKSNPWVDFYIVKEGEIALQKLTNQLISNNYNIQDMDIFSSVPNLVAYRQGTLLTSTKTDRVNDLNSIPSPYLTGKLDKFLDGRLMPVIQTNRGCPFSCAFCTEGQGFWNKVRKKSNDLIGSEIRYIADTLSKLPKEKTRGDLLIADSNFGMFPDDLKTCDAISDVQKTHHYPSYINVATGKNKKERVLEAARRVNGAMKLAGSVQSLDPEVQSHMKRSNISADEIVSLALQASEIGTNTYSEVILALPGDTKEKHYKTLEALVEADFSTISMYQLMLLPGTEFGDQNTIKFHEMTVRFRAIPRAFGQYSLLGETFNISEIEQICVEHNTLSYSEYLQCRRLNLIVNIFFNDRVFYETLNTVRWMGLSVFNLLLSISETQNNDQFEKLVSQFLTETEAELWDDQQELESFIEEPNNMARYISGEYGSNLIFKFKALSLTEYLDAICETLKSNLSLQISSSNLPSKRKLNELLAETVEYKRLQLNGIFSNASDETRQFVYPVNELDDYLSSSVPDKLNPAKTRTLRFSHTSDQLLTIDSYKNIFGDNIIGVSRTLARARLTTLFRNSQVVN